MNERIEMISDTIVLPAVWKYLVQIDFPEGLEGVANGDVVGEEVAVDDPQAYYDDHRVVTNGLSDGAKLITVLTSGQENYWAKHRVRNEREETYAECEAFFAFEDTERMLVGGGRKYVIDIEWSLMPGDHANANLPSR